MSSDLSTGKTIFILAVVVGCFAVLWPKVFYPMLTASVKQSGSSQVVNWRDAGNAHLLAQLCFLIEEQQDPTGFRRLSDETCIEFVKKSCGVVVSEKVAQDFRLSKDKTNLTFCLQQRFDITLESVLSTAPPTTRTKPYQSQSLPHPHVRPERPSNLHPDSTHPALREKGRTIPYRTIEKQARPGPMPGVRPPMGGGGHMVPPQTKGSGAMGIIMPLYTVGIVIFFVYTIMKVLFKKSDEEETKIPKLKDFHLDPEYRKYVFAEEYLDSSNASHRDLLKRQERESSKQRRRQDSASQPDTKIEDEQMDQLRRRLEETEKAMERLMSQMGSVTDKLTAAKITEVLSQAQSQARILKMGLDNVVSCESAEGNEAPVPPAPSTSLTTFTLTSTPSKVTFVPSPQQIFYTMDAAEGGSDEDLTTSEAFTNTLSEDFSLPLALQRHLEELKVKDMYLKGTSAGNFGSPPIPPDELESPNGRHNSIQGSAPLIATNTTLLSSFTKESDTIPTDKINQLDGIESEKYIQREKIKEHNLDPQDEKQIPVVDFPLQVSSSLKQNLKNDKKQKEDLVLSSDIAQYEAPGGHSEREGSSDASETGADISELKSFADNGAIEVTGSVPIPVVEEQSIPEVTYSPRFTEATEIDEENVARIPTIQGSDGKQYNLHMKSPAVEHGTQTDENQKLSVLNLRTTYQIDKNEQKKSLNIKEVEDKVNEIVLDATLPIDTQLLVKEAQTGSAVTNNIEIDSSEIGSEPCVVTSQVSLAFIGLEHNDTEGPYTLVFPEARPKIPLDVKNVILLPQLLSDKQVKSDGFVEGKSNSECREHLLNEVLQPDENKFDTESEHAPQKTTLDCKFSLFCKNNEIIQQPEESNELKQKYLVGSEISDSTNLSIPRNEISDNVLGDINIRNILQCTLDNEEVSPERVSNFECSGITKQVQDLSNDSPKDKNNEIYLQSLQHKEEKQRDPGDGDYINTLQESELIKKEEHIDENIGVFQQLTDKNEKNYDDINTLHQSVLIEKVEERIDGNTDKEKKHSDDINALHQSELVKKVEECIEDNIRISQQLVDKDENSGDDINALHQSELVKKVEECIDENICISQQLIDKDKNNGYDMNTELITEVDERIDENIGNFQQRTDKDEENGTHQLHTLENSLNQKFSEELDFKDGDLVCDKTHENINESIVKPCEGLVEIPKTVSLESFDLTPEILHGLEEPTNDEEFIAIEFMRPQSPVPPTSDNSNIDNGDTLFICNENIHSIPETCKDVKKAGVQVLASTLVEETTKNALQHISNLTPDEISKHKNEALNFLETSIDNTQNKNTSILYENKEESSQPLESNIDFQSNLNVQEQPGEVVGSGESGGENENIFVATIQCITKFSPPGSPFASDINTSFSLENVNLTDHCTQSVTPTSLIEDPTLKAEDGCIKELRSPSPDSSTLIAETIREQESVFKRSHFDSHENDMNHKG